MAIEGERRGCALVRVHEKTHENVHGDNKKLSTKHWATIFGEYNLHESVAECLPDPPTDLNVDREMAVALAMANSGNPAGSPSAQLERYLERCHVLNQSELYGLFGAIMESPTLQRPIAVRCQVAALKYLARTSAIQNTTYTRQSVMFRHD